jgi:hypothetical protein
MTVAISRPYVEDCANDALMCEKCNLAYYNYQSVLCAQTFAFH